MDDLVGGGGRCSDAESGGGTVLRILWIEGRVHPPSLIVTPALRGVSPGRGVGRGRVRGFCIYVRGGLWESGSRRGDGLVEGTPWLVP